MHKAEDWREVGGGRRDGPKGMGLGPLSLHFFCSVIDPSLVIVQGWQAWPSHKSPPLVESSSGVKERSRDPPGPWATATALAPYFSDLPLASPRASPSATLSSLHPSLYHRELRLDRLGQEKDDHGR